MVVAVSCVLRTTPDRAWVLPLAIEWWRRQTFVDRELVVVADVDGVDAVWEAVDRQRRHRRDTPIRVIPVPSGKPSWEKLNTGCEWAEKPWIAVWDDDDWHHPQRLERLVELLPGNELVGLTRMFVHELGGSRRTWDYQYPVETHTPCVIGGTMVFARRLWERQPFPPKPGYDPAFVVHHHQSGAKLAWRTDILYCAMLHGSNVANRTPTAADPFWTPVSEVALRAHLGDDLIQFESAFRNGPHHL